MRKVAVVALVLVLVVATPVLAASKKTGKVAAPKGVVIELKFPGDKTLIVTSKGKRLPAGTYTPESYVLMKKGKSGQIYKLASGSPPKGETSWSFTVEEGKTTKLDWGQPLTVRIVRMTSHTDKKGVRTIPIGFRIVGKNGETYSLTVRVGARRAPAPLIQIESAKGKVLVRDKFEYG